MEVARARYCAATNPGLNRGTGMVKRLVDCLVDLVAIDSVNPRIGGGDGEIALGNYVAGRLKAIGLAPQMQFPAENRPNVVAVIPGRDENRSILFNAHMDTVGVEGMDAPFCLRPQGDRLYGRGTYDMKGSLAVLLMLAEHFAQHPPPVSLIFTFVSDEEAGSLGMKYLVSNFLPTLAPPVAGIFLEPTEEHIGVGHKGFCWYEIEIVGKAAHGSMPAQGIDAILPLRGALSELHAINSELISRPEDPLLGTATLHGSLVSGGEAMNVIPAGATLKWERRTLFEETPGDTDREMDRIVAAVRSLPGNHRVSGRRIAHRPAYKTPRASDILNRFRIACPNSAHVGMSYWSDAALAGQAGIASVLYGPKGHGAHAVDEWVSRESLHRVLETLKTLVRQYKDG